MDAFISYEGLPVSAGGGHSLGKRPVRKIFQEALSFIQTFASVKVYTTEITFFASQDKSYSALSTIWKLTKLFGLPRWDWWDLQPRQHFWKWKVKYNQVEEALRVLDSYSDFPPNDYGPLILSFHWHFHFKDLNSGEVLKGQDEIPELDVRQRSSNLYLRLGQKSTISAWLTLPFAQLDQEAKGYILKMSDALPFKPSEKHWRL